jgi:hypothetical protein
MDDFMRSIEAEVYIGERFRHGLMNHVTKRAVTPLEGSAAALKHLHLRDRTTDLEVHTLVEVPALMTMA